ncbi:MAG TPA: YggT family protein [Thermodesulfovibrionales bacterium]|jgi:YggT family protein|nr:YggT family protein [Thermodesulfovibrionales bacterium]
MFVFGNLLFAVATILDYVLGAYKWIIIISALLSWVSPDPHNPIVRFLYSVTEPALRPIRRLIGYRLGPIDISPIIAILVIIFIQMFLIGSLREFAFRLKGGVLI